MSRHESIPTTVTTRSQLEIPTPRGMLEAHYIYDRFTDTSSIEILAMLSLTFRIKDIGHEKIIFPGWIEKFKKEGYVLPTEAPSMRKWLTRRGHVAVSMVDAEIFDSGIDTQLHEPFLGYAIMPQLYKSDRPKMPLVGDTYYSYTGI